MVGECASGREKEIRGQTEDIALATACDASSAVPTLVDDRLVDANT